MYLIEIVEALLQTPQAADAGLQQAPSAGVLLKHNNVPLIPITSGFSGGSPTVLRHDAPTRPFSWLWMYMRTSRGILTSVMMKEPLATVPRW